MVSIIDFYVLQKRPSKEGFDIVIGNPPYGANIDDLVSLSLIPQHYNLTLFISS